MPVVNLFRSSAAASATPPPPSARLLLPPPASHFLHIVPPSFSSHDLPPSPPSPLHPAAMLLSPSAPTHHRPRRLLPFPTRFHPPPNYKSAMNHDYSSSGSEHDPSSVCLAEMVHEFLSQEDGAAGHDVGTCGFARCNCTDGVCSGDDTGVDDDDGAGDVAPSGGKASTSLEAQQICEILEGVTSYTNNPEFSVLVDVVKAVEVEIESGTVDVSAGEALNNSHVRASRLRRPVMKRLREESGYDAAICKSRWDHREGLPAGDYEYMDVVVPESGGPSPPASPKNGTVRLIVDIDFRAQFEIARASSDYTQLLEVVPKIFVGRVERLKQILKIMANAAKKSLKQQGLHLPPWRKLRYLQAKWFSAYRRTTNASSAANTVPPPPDGNADGTVPRPRKPDAGGDMHTNPDDQALLALGIRSRAEYQVFSTVFTKEMDMAFFNAGAVPAQRKSGAGRWKGVRAAGAAEGICRKEAEPARYAGFAGDGGARRRAGECTVMFTDWQLPELEKPRPGFCRTSTNGDQLPAMVGGVRSSGSSMLHRELMQKSQNRAAMAF